MKVSTLDGGAEWLVRDRLDSMPAGTILQFNPDDCQYEILSAGRFVRITSPFPTAYARIGEIFLVADYANHRAYIHQTGPTLEESCRR